MRRNKYTNDVVGSSGFSSNACSLFTLTVRGPLATWCKRPKRWVLFSGHYRTYINHIFVLAAGASLIDKHVVCLKQSKTQNTRNISLEMDDALKNHLKAKHLLNKSKNITWQNLSHCPICTRELLYGSIHCFLCLTKSVNVFLFVSYLSHISYSVLWQTELQTNTF